METSFSNDFDKWDIDVDFSSVTEEVRAAIVFVPIFISSIYLR